jgi:hypothetical protein
LLSRKQDISSILHQKYPFHILQIAALSASSFICFIFRHQKNVLATLFKPIFSEMCCMTVSDGFLDRFLFIASRPILHNTATISENYNKSKVSNDEFWYPVWEDVYRPSWRYYLHIDRWRWYLSKDSVAIKYPKNIFRSETLRMHQHCCFTLLLRHLSMCR